MLLFPFVPLDFVSISLWFSSISLGFSSISLGFSSISLGFVSISRGTHANELSEQTCIFLPCVASLFMAGAHRLVPI